MATSAKTVKKLYGVRGKRADLLIVDDLEDDMPPLTDEMRAKVLNFAKERHGN